MRCFTAKPGHCPMPLSAAPLRVSSGPPPSAHAIPFDFSRITVHSEHDAAIARGLGSSPPGHGVVDSAACHARGVPAFTDGAISYFESPRPSLKIAAHEAVHRAQHAGGIRDAGLGAELHAHAVATRVALGRETGDLMTAGGAVVPPATRHYKDIPVADQSAHEWNAKFDLRVADDGTMAVAQEENEGGRHAWAFPTLITGANAALSAVGSVVRLKADPGDQIAGAVPEAPAYYTLHRIVPENTSEAATASPMKLWADCGRSSGRLRRVPASSIARAL